MGTIRNGKNYSVSKQTGTIPNMSDAMYDWFQYLTFEQVVKTVTAFQVIETTTPISFWGILQPLTGRDLIMKPEGQRKWNWIMVHSQTQLPLGPDDVIIFSSTQYRVMTSKNHSLYSYFYYELIEDYEGSGPATS